jgi:hypothetical protein
MKHVVKDVDDDGASRLFYLLLIILSAYVFYVLGTMLELHVIHH